MTVSSAPATDTPSPQQVGTHMFAADRASRGLGMRIVGSGPAAPGSR